MLYPISSPFCINCIKPHGLTLYQDHNNTLTTSNTGLQVLLFSWPTAREVWLNYEVVMFQPWSGTAQNLGSVTNIMSYLQPAPPFNWFIDLFLSTSVSWFPPHTLPLGWYAPLFPHPNIPFLFWSCITCPPEQESTPADLHRMFLNLLSFLPLHDTQFPIGPCIPTPQAYFYRLVFRLVAPFFWPRHC